MNFFNKDYLGFIRKKINITSLLSDYGVDLIYTGNQCKCLSPFTSEKTPSFYVLKSSTYFKCFSSGYYGDIFTFIKLKESLNFQEAVFFLIKKYGLSSGVRVNAVRKVLKEVGACSTKKLIFMCKWASHFYHKSLMFNVLNRFLLIKYFYVYRKTSLELIKFFKLGVTNYTDCINKEVKKLKFTEDVLKESQLFYTGTPFLKPKLVGRVVIPVFNSNKELIFFSGRSIYGAQLFKNTPKYLSIVNNLCGQVVKIFNINVLKTFSERKDVFIVEGPFDVFRLISFGCLNVISLLGTNVRFKEVLKFKNYFKKLYVFFDNDFAGINSSLKFVNFSIKNGVGARFVYFLNKKSDPDLFFKKYTKTKRCIMEFIKSKSLSATEYLIKLFLNKKETLLVYKDFKERLNYVFSFIKNFKNLFEVQKFLNVTSVFTYTNIDVLKNEYNTYLFFTKKEMWGYSKVYGIKKTLNYFPNNLYMYSKTVSAVTFSPLGFFKTYGLEKNVLYVNKHVLKKVEVVGIYNQLPQRFMYEKLLQLLNSFMSKYYFNVGVTETFNGFKKEFLCVIMSKVCLLKNKLKKIRTIS